MLEKVKRFEAKLYKRTALKQWKNAVDHRGQRSEPTRFIP